MAALLLVVAPFDLFSCTRFVAQRPVWVIDHFVRKRTNLAIFGAAILIDCCGRTSLWEATNEKRVDTVVNESAVVLVVEDEVLLRMAVADFLEDLRFGALEAENADKAIALLQNCPEIRLVFTDIEMSGSMNGLKLANVVHDRWPPVAIVVTSGAKIPDVADLPPDAEFLPKPYSFDQVAETFLRLSQAGA